MFARLENGCCRKRSVPQVMSSSRTTSGLASKFLPFVLAACLSTFASAAYASQVVQWFNGWIKPTISNDGRTLFVVTRDGTVEEWDVASGRLRKSASLGASDLAISRDGHTVAILSHYESSDECRVLLYDVPEFHLQRILTITASYGQGLDFLADGKTLVAYGGHTYEWNYRTGSLKSRLKLEIDSGMDGTESASADGSRIAQVVFGPSSLTTQIRIWNTKSGKQIAFMDFDSRLFHLGEEGEPIRTSAISPDGRSIAIAIDASTPSSIEIWRINPLDKIMALHNSQMSTDNMSYLSRGSSLLCWSIDGKFIVWNLKTRQLTKTRNFKHSSGRDATFSRNGHWRTVYNRTEVTVYNVRTSRIVRVFPWKTE